MVRIYDLLLINEDPNSREKDMKVWSWGKYNMKKNCLNKKSTSNSFQTMRKPEVNLKKIYKRFFKER